MRDTMQYDDDGMLEYTGPAFTTTQLLAIAVVLASWDGHVSGPGRSYVSRMRQGADVSQGRHEAQAAIDRWISEGNAT